MKKLIIGILIAIPVILGAILLYVYLNLNSLVVQAVETFAPPVTGTPVTLGSSDISLFSGTGKLSDLVIGNPKGYKADSAFELGSIKVALDTESVTSDPIVIKSIDVVAPAITYEPGGKAGSNLQQLLRNVESNTKKKEGEASKEPAKEEKPGPKVVIDRVSITQGKVNLVTPLSSTPVHAPLPPIELTDIGRKKGGVSSQEAFKQVMDKILAAATKIGAGSLSELKTQLKGKVDEEVNKLKAKAGGLTEGIEGKSGGLGDKLKGLLK